MLFITVRKDRGCSAQTCSPYINFIIHIPKQVGCHCRRQVGHNRYIGSAALASLPRFRSLFPSAWLHKFNLFTWACRRNSELHSPWHSLGMAEAHECVMQVERLGHRRGKCEISVLCTQEFASFFNGDPRGLLAAFARARPSVYFKLLFDLTPARRKKTIFNQSNRSIITLYFQKIYTFEACFALIPSYQKEKRQPAGWEPWFWPLLLDAKSRKHWPGFCCQVFGLRPARGATVPRVSESFKSFLKVLFYAVLYMALGYLIFLLFLFLCF